jgi:hypothetical protein
LMIYKLYPAVGLIYMFYPQSIIYSVMFTKVTLMVFLSTLAIYFFRDKKPVYIIFAVLFIQLLFSSVFNFFPHTPAIMGEFNRGIIHKVVGLWEPAFNHTPQVVGNWIQYVQAPFYLLLMFLFVRCVRWNYVWIIVIIFTVGAMFQYAHPFHREFLIPMILLTVVKEKA